MNFPPVGYVAFRQQKQNFRKILTGVLFPKGNIKAVLAVQKRIQTSITGI